jgi:hypothetical protein
LFPIFSHGCLKGLPKGTDLIVAIDIAQIGRPGIICCDEHLWSYDTSSGKIIAHRQAAFRSVSIISRKLSALAFDVNRYSTSSSFLSVAVSWTTHGFREEAAILKMIKRLSDI